MLETYTDRELIKELSSRHDKILVIRPDIKNTSRLKVYCNTVNDIDAPYTLIDATEMLQDAQIAIITDCFEAISNE